MPSILIRVPRSRPLRWGFLCRWLIGGKLFGRAKEAHWGKGQNYSECGVSYSLLRLVTLIPDLECEPNQEIGLTWRQHVWSFVTLCHLASGYKLPKGGAGGGSTLSAGLKNSAYLRDVQSSCISIVAKRKFKCFHCWGRTSAISCSETLKLSRELREHSE